MKRTVFVLCVAVALNAAPVYAQTPEQRPHRPISGNVDFNNSDDAVGAKIELSYDAANFGPTIADLEPYGRLYVDADVSSKISSPHFESTIKGGGDVTYFGIFGPTYNFVRLAPIDFTADQDFRNIDYTPKLTFGFEVTPALHLTHAIQKITGCEGSVCDAQGPLFQAGVYGEFVQKKSGDQLDRSDKTSAGYSVDYHVPLSTRWDLQARYEWKSQSDDGTSKEQNEVALVYYLGCVRTAGVKLSWINGEFGPTEKLAEGVRLGLTSLFGKSRDGPQAC